MSYPVKLTLFLLAFNLIGFADGYLLHELGRRSLVPVVLVMAYAAVLVSRHFLRERIAKDDATPAPMK
jgi:hypothetical protein